MSDLLQLGASGIRVYQSALKTVSNNIANAGSADYSRQTAVAQAETPLMLGPHSIGTGAYTARISRAYDAAIENSVRQSSSDVSAQQPMIDFTNRVLDVIGSQTAGLSQVLDDFFSAAEALSSDPASTVLRSDFLDETDNVAARFRELSGQVMSNAADSQSFIETQIEELNRQAEQLGIINQQLGLKPTESKQSPALLDQRDAILRSMSELVKINVDFNEAGQASVKIGTNTDQNRLVTATKTYALSAVFDPSNAGNAAFTIDALGEDRTISTPYGGTIAGALTFRSQVLQPTLEQIDDLAEAFAAKINEVHQQGLDANGDAGTALYSINTGATYSAQTLTSLVANPDLVATSGSLRVQNATTNLSNTAGAITYSVQPSSANFQIQFDTDASYSILDTAGATISTGNPYDASTGVTHDGVTITFDEAIVSGDTFIIEPNTNAGGDNSNLKSLISLQDAKIMSGSSTFSESYLSMINGVGNKSQISSVSLEALSIVQEQNLATKSSISGVDLDQEAADLIRYQQAYQASAQVIQTANRIFDAILSAA